LELNFRRFTANTDLAVLYYSMLSANFRSCFFVSLTQCINYPKRQHICVDAHMDYEDSGMDTCSDTFFANQPTDRPTD
jgi:hypothetical protein